MCGTHDGFAPTRQAARSREAWARNRQQHFSDVFLRPSHLHTVFPLTLSLNMSLSHPSLSSIGQVTMQKQQLDQNTKCKYERAVKICEKHLEVARARANRLYFTCKINVVLFGGQQSWSFWVYMHHYPWITQKSHVLPIVKAHEHLIFARIPYKNIVNEETIGKFSK